MSSCAVIISPSFLMASPTSFCQESEVCIISSAVFAFCATWDSTVLSLRSTPLSPVSMGQRPGARVLTPPWACSKRSLAQNYPRNCPMTALVRGILEVHINRSVFGRFHATRSRHRPPIPFELSSDPRTQLLQVQRLSALSSANLKTAKRFPMAEHPIFTETPS